MNSLYKRIRHVYWLLTHFVRRNIRFLSISFVAGFFLIIIFINFFPFVQSILTRKNESIGIAGQYSLQSIPNEVTQLISSPLITVDSNGDITPVLAHSWQTLDEGKTYRFHLKNDLFWTDKKPFRAQDIKYNFKDVQIQVIDDYTIDFKLKQPLNIFPIYLTQPVVKYPLVGVGALYSVDRYKVKNDLLTSVSLSPNKAGLPYKVFRFYNTEEDLVGAYKKGEINYFRTSNQNIKDVFTHWSNTKITKDINPNGIMTLFMNTQKQNLSDRDFRKGIAYALPSFENYGIPAKSSIPSTSWAYSDDVKQYPQNEERSRSLLGSEDSKGKPVAKLKLYTFFDYVQTAELIKKALENVGISVELKVTSYVPDDYDLLLTVWNPPNDPDQYFFWHSTQGNTNLTKLNNQKIDLLLEQGRRVVNVVQRKSIYADFQKTLTDEVPARFLYYPFVYTIQRK